MADGRSLAAQIKTRHLTLLLALDEHRSVLRASQALHMTQPTCSKLLSQLEATLGVALFERHARGIATTAFGDILIRHARAVLTELRHAQEEVAELRSGLSGRVAIGTEATSATGLVPRAVVLLKQRFARVSVSIELAFSETLVHALQTGRLEIAVARVQNLQDLAQLDYEPLPQARHAIAVRAGHRLAGRRRVTLRELAEQTWVVPPPGNVMRSALTLLFLEQHLDFPRQVVETAALPVIMGLLRASDMVAPLPEQIVTPECDAGRIALLPIRLDLRLGPAGIVTRRGVALSPAAQAMLRALREAAGGTATGLSAASVGERQSPDAGISAARPK